MKLRKKEEVSEHACSSNAELRLMAILLRFKNVDLTEYPDFLEFFLFLPPAT